MTDEPYEIIDDTLWIRDPTVTELFICGFRHGKIDLSALTMCRSLRRLQFTRFWTGIDLTPLASLPRLKNLALFTTTPRDWVILHDLKSLTILQIYFRLELLRSPFPRGFLPPALRALAITEHHDDLSFLEGNETIKYLDLDKIKDGYVETILSMKSLKQISRRCIMSFTAQKRFVDRGIKIASIPPKVWL